MTSHDILFSNSNPGSPSWYITLRHMGKWERDGFPGKKHGGCMGRMHEVCVRKLGETAQAMCEHREARTYQRDLHPSLVASPLILLAESGEKFANGNDVTVRA